MLQMEGGEKPQVRSPQFKPHPLYLEALHELGGVQESTDGLCKRPVAMGTDSTVGFQSLNVERHQLMMLAQLMDTEDRVFLGESGKDGVHQVLLGCQLQGASGC